MTSDPVLDLGRLREIGWTHWDPIGLAPPDENCVDEYDSYMREAAVMLWTGASGSAAADYLAAIEKEHMGQGPRPSAMARAQAAVNAIADYLSELRTS